MLKSLYGAAVVTVCLGISAMNQTPQEFSGAPETSKTEMRRVPLSELEKINPLNSKEEWENYRSTWDETLSLEDNLTRLCQRFLDTCCQVLAGSGVLGVNRKIWYGGMPRAKIDLFLNTLHQVSHNPVGCKLIRLLLTKYLSDTTALRFSKAYIVSSNTKGTFNFHFSSLSKGFCFISVSDFPDNDRSMYVTMYEEPMTEELAQEIRRRGGSIDQIERFHGMSFFGDLLGDDVVLFDTMLCWFHHVSGVDIESLMRSGDVILKRYEQVGHSNRSALTSDYYFRGKFGFVYDEASDSMKMDLLNESSYTLVGNSVIPIPFCFTLEEADIDFIRSFGDKELFEFYLTGQAKLPVFGVGQYKYTH